MTDEQEDQQATMGDVFDAVVGGMTKKQFRQLAERTGHTEIDPKEEAAQALAQLVRGGNLDADRLTASQVAAKLPRRGRRP